VDPHPDPDPGGQKLPTKVEKEISCFEMLFRAEGFFYSLESFVEA
jgi:hypothetical protein